MIFQWYWLFIPGYWTGCNVDTSQQGSVSMNVGGNTAALYALLVALCVTAFYPSIFHEFTFDDHLAIESNPDVNGANSDVHSLWLHDIWGKDLAAQDSHRSYRPLLIMIFRYTFLCFSKQSYIIRTISLLFHIFATIMVQNVIRSLCCFSSLLSFILLRRQAPSGLSKTQTECILDKNHIQSIFSGSESDVFGFVPAALFAVHPVHVEAVVAVVNLAEPVSAVLVLGAFQLFINSVSRDLLYGVLGHYDNVIASSEQPVMWQVWTCYLYGSHSTQRTASSDPISQNCSLAVVPGGLLALRMLLWLFLIICALLLKETALIGCVLVFSTLLVGISVVLAAKARGAEWCLTMPQLRGCTRNNSPESSSVNREEAHQGKESRHNQNIGNGDGCSIETHIGQTKKPGKHTSSTVQLEPLSPVSSCCELKPERLIKAADYSFRVVVRWLIWLGLAAAAGILYFWLRNVCISLSRAAVSDGRAGTEGLVGGAAITAYPPMENSFAEDAAAADGWVPRLGLSYLQGDSLLLRRAEKPVRPAAWLGSCLFPHGNTAAFSFSCFQSLAALLWCCFRKHYTIFVGVCVLLLLLHNLYINCPFFPLHDPPKKTIPTAFFH